MYNVGFGTFEKSKEEIGSTHSQLKSSYWDSLKSTAASAWNYNPTSSLFRVTEQIQAYQQSHKYLNKDELNKKYADLGLVFKEDTREGIVEFLVKRKEIEKQRQDVMSRGPTNNFAKGTFFLTSLGTSFADPINIAASFVPFVGQAKFASMVARSGKNIARMKRGFVEGLIGNTAIEPIVFGVAQSEQADYDQWDAFTNIAAGGFIGSAAHVGFGRLGDFIAEKRGKPKIYQKLAAISPENQQALLKYSIGKHLRGEKVDTGDLIVKKTRIGDEQLNKLDDQISEFKTLYQKAIDSGDRKSAKVYLQNLRNLQKTERQLVEAKRKANDKALAQEKTNANIRNETGMLTEQDIEVKNKNTSELETEAQILNDRNKFHQKQLDIKDEELTPEMKQDRADIQKIDNNIQNKTTIRDAIRAGANCVKRGT